MGEPGWWAEARRLLDEGLPQREVAKRLGKSQSAVNRSTDPEGRKNDAARRRDNEASRDVEILRAGWRDRAYRKRRRAEGVEP